MSNLPDKIKKDMAMDRIGRKLCKFLEEYYSQDIIEFRVAMQSPDHFIIHPINVDGKTLDVKWDFNNTTYGNKVFGYINKGNEFDESPSPTGDRDCEELKKEVEQLKVVNDKLWDALIKRMPKEEIEFIKNALTNL